MRGGGTGRSVTAREASPYTNCRSSGGYMLHSVTLQEATLKTTSEIFFKKIKKIVSPLVTTEHNQDKYSKKRYVVNSLRRHPVNIPYSCKDWSMQDSN